MIEFVSNQQMIIWSAAVNLAGPCTVIKRVEIGLYLEYLVSPTGPPRFVSVHIFQ